MNYKFPLINLITRGHIRVENPTATKQFINSLSDNASATLFEQLSNIEDVGECARFLTMVKEEYELETGRRSLPSQDSFAQQRDMFFLKEDSDENKQQTLLADTQKLIKLIKVGAPAYLVVKFLATFDEDYRKKVIYNAGQLKDEAGKYLRKLIFGDAVANAFGRAKRIAGSMLLDKNKVSSSMVMNDGDKKFLKKVGIGGLIATGLVATILAVGASYKRWFSKEAKACKKYSGKTRTVCMTKARIAAAKEAIKMSEEALANCDSASKPADCRFKMRVEVRSWMKKKRAEEEKLEKLLKVQSGSFKSDEDKPDPFS